MPTSLQSMKVIFFMPVLFSIANEKLQFLKEQSIKSLLLRSHFVKSQLVKEHFSNSRPDSLFSE